MNSKIRKNIILGVTAIIVAFLAYIGTMKYYHYRENKKIKEAIIKVDLKEKLEVVFNDEVYVNDFIKSINGKLIENAKVDTNKVGKQNVNFHFINDDGIKVPYSFEINIKDVTPPTIWLSSVYTVNKGYSKVLEEAIMCGDDTDDNPTCKIIGNYDVNKIGSYALVYEATDASGNKTSKKFTLKVTKPSTSTTPSKVNKKYMKDIIAKYKNENTKIGIDVSKWQGTIDYEKVKKAGVEFVFIKIGGTNGLDGDYYTDPMFERNYEGFKKVGIPIGLYFYSYANTKEKAINDANWVINKIKGYEIDLPIAYDWENWSSYNKFNLSFYNLTNNALSFIETVNKANYEGLLYSSKSYLESIWLKGNYPVWLAHYTSKTNYEGKYKVWQMCSTGVIDGITENTVDIDIMYLN